MCEITGSYESFRHTAAGGHGDARVNFDRAKKSLVLHNEFPVYSAPSAVHGFLSRPLRPLANFAVKDLAFDFFP